MAIVCLVIVAIYVVIGFASLLPVFDKEIDRSLSQDKASLPPTLILTSPDGSRHLAPPAYWLGLEGMGRSVLWAFFMELASPC